MWFGTRDGLNRYDGQKFTVYKHDNSDSSSISNNDILEIISDSQGDLWIGTFNGLNKYDYNRDSFVSYLNDAEDPYSISDNGVWAVCEAANGDIWVGTANGLNRFDKERGRFERFYHNSADNSSISDNYVLDIYEDRQGEIWVATARGLNKLEQYQDGTVRFKSFLQEGGISHTLSDNFTQSIAEGPDGNLWIGTKYGGINKLNTDTGKFESFQHDPEKSNSVSHNDIRSLSFDKEGRLWIGSYNGLNLLDVESQRFQKMFNDKDDPNTLSKNSVKSVFIDDNGTVWIGTYYGGVNMLDPQYNNFKNYKYKSDHSGLNYDVVSALIEGKDGEIYVGTEGGGVNILNAKTGKFTQLTRKSTSNALSSNNIKSLYLDDRNKLWIGTFNDGLNILNLQTGKIENFREEGNNINSLSNNNVYAVNQQNDSLFWLATHGGGLNLFNYYTGKYLHFQEGDNSKLTSNLVRNLFKDSKGNLWVGTQYGLNFLAAEEIGAHENFVFKPYFYDQKKISGEDILTIYEDSKGRIWVGTNESGLNLFDPVADKFINYNLYPISGSTSNVVHGILEDNGGDLWISTNQGIIKFNPEDKTFRRFGESDGLVSNEFNNNSCLKSRNGRMYFGSLEGLTTFHPDSITINPHAPAVVLTDFRLFGESVPVSSDGVLDKIIAQKKQLTLDYDQAIFSFEFAIPNYINPAKNQYAYRLKGLEDKWNYTDNNVATYTIQKAGTYTFEVKGANNDGLWNPIPTTIEVKVNPAPWKTWWAFLLYATGIIVALYLLINIIWSRSQLKHELELEHINHERKESLNQMKLQFFTNISHEFRTPLTLILGPLEQIISNYRGSNALFKQLLAIEKNANRMLRLIDQLMDFRKFENNHLQLKAAEGNIVVFVKEIYLSFKQYAKLHSFEYEFISDREEILVWYDRDKMERVIFNLISNAFKYTPEGSQIKVMVGQEARKVVISVVDNGIGMAPEHLEKIFERFYEVGQSENQLTTKYKKGTGIGLALAKGVVDLHSGEIKVESCLNEGSKFTVLLPLGNSHLEEGQMIRNFKGSDDIGNYEIAPYLPEGIPETAVGLELPKDAPTILVVEDNNDVRKYIVQLFKVEYNILEAANGKEGMKEAMQHEPDIIISDVMMPEMDGIEFCSQIKLNIKTSHIPVILLTARTSLVFKYEGLEMGADDYINKPFNVKELKLKVKNLISSRKKLKEKFTSESVVKPGDITVSSLDEKLMEKALQIVEDNISNEFFDIATFSEELGVSRTMLFTKIKAWTNLTPNEFLQVMRMKRAAQLLEQNKLNVSQVGFKVGFKNPKYFSKCFQRHFSETPTAYAKKFSSPDEAVES